MFWAVSGCFWISDDDLAAAVAEREAAPPRVDAVSPTYGLTTGGEEVTLTGRGLGPDVEVRFGDVVAEVKGAEADQVRVLAPPAEAEGSVEVSVRRGDQVSRLDEAYDYWADGTDLVGVVGSLWYFQRRGDYWAASEVDEAFLHFRMIRPEPEYVYWRYWSEALDTCSANPPSPYTFTSYDLGATEPELQATLTSATTEATATWDADYGGFVADPFPVRALYTTQSWRLQPVEVEGFPPFATAELMVTPGAWEVTAPRIDGSTLSPASITPLTVTWSGSGAVATLIQVGLMSADDVEMEAELFCAVTDDGSFEVPAEFTAGWPLGRDVHLLVGRYLAPVGTLDYTHARAAVYVMDWRYGAVRAAE